MGNFERVVYEFVRWSLDPSPSKRRLMSPDDLEITVGTREFDLLRMLVQRSQQVLSHDNTLIAALILQLDIPISRFRHKIEQDQKNPHLLKQFVVEAMCRDDVMIQKIINVINLLEATLIKRRAKAIRR